ncbi:MAG: AAA family ATPase [Patescibacteria group bacterium]|nr:AAA family ATPase [Patescibacteria group bacterium]
MLTKMIKKLTKINNVLSYSFFDWDKINLVSFVGNDGNQKTHDGHFVKNNVIFAENANGKSKLVDIFKSLDGRGIKLDKHRDRKAEGQEAKIILDDDSEIEFFGTGWSNEKLKSKFVIFDKPFVHNFVHSVGTEDGDTPLRRQKRGKNIVYLGNFEKYSEEIERVNSLKTVISEKNRLFFQTGQAKISGLLNGHDISTYELISKKSEIQKLNKDNLQKNKDQYAKQQTDLAKIEKSLKDKNKIASLSLLTKVEKIFTLKIESVEQEKKREIDIDPTALFSFTVARGVQQTLHKIAHKKDFVQQGLSLLTNEAMDCPFCEQKIKNGDYIQVVKDYQEIFDESFANEEDNIRTLLSKYKNILEGLRDLQPPSSNLNVLNQVKPFITAGEELPELVIADNEKELIKTEIDLVLGKDKKILDKVDGSKIDQIKSIIESATLLIKKYNEAVEKINTEIKQLKKDSLEGKLNTKKEEVQKEVDRLKNEIFFIENKESIEKYFEVIEKKDKNDKIIEALERTYQALKTKIVEQFGKFVEDYFELIKGFVKEISPSMEILNINGQPTYDRRNTQDPAQCGFSVKYNGEDCAGSLSEGEKQVIALAFFFADLRKDSNKNKIVVLDDPITSFDAGKRKSTAELMQRETKDFDQLFVFTCDPLFREYCLKQIADERNFYYIFKTKGSSSIHYAPKDKETIYTSFETEFKDIGNVVGSNENVVIYGQKLRFCLETKIKEDYFGYSEDNLSNMIKKVTGRNKEEFEKLFDNKEVILQIYSYCNTGGLAHYPKDGSTSWSELNDKIKQYLDLEL